jgi:hypothetical protein
MIPVAVFPEMLSRAFSEVQTWAANVSEFHDGSSQRGSLVDAPRHSWRLTKRLPPAALVALYDFLSLHVADSFYFYNPSETVPPNHGDETGVATAGRYALRWNSDWSQSTGIALTDAAVELIEVASMSVLMNTWITLSPAKGLSAAGEDLAPPLGVLLASDSYAFRCLSATAKSKFGSIGYFDVLYKPAGASEWISIFPGGVGIEIDAARVTVFSDVPLDIPNGSDIRLDCLSISPVSDDEFSVQIRGDVVAA